MRLPAAVAALLLLTPLHAQTPSPTPFTAPPNLQDRYFAISTSAPITARTPRAAARRISKLLTFITFIDSAVSTAAEASLSSTRPREDVLTTCNHRGGDRWEADIAIYFGLRGWHPADPDCISDVYGTGRRDGVSIQGLPDPGFSRDDVYHAVVRRATDLDRAAPAVASDALRGNWSAPTRATDFVYNIRTQKCTHDYATFVRLRGEWYLESRLTNADKDLTLGPRERQFLYEYVRADESGRMLAPARMRVRQWGKEGADAFTDRATTLLASLSGGVAASGFGTVFAADNIAVQDALRAGEHETQQASDATTTSNIAILALPLAMNLVPVALVADVNSVGMLLYTLLTDVLTTVPLAIKGVEVLWIGLTAQTSVVTRVTGAQLKGDGEKAGEVWVAQCVATGNLRPTGIVLLCVALLFMVGGIVAEFVARRWVRKRRRGKGNNVVGFADGGEGGVQAAALIMATEGARGNKVE